MSDTVAATKKHASVQIEGRTRRSIFTAKLGRVGLRQVAHGVEVLTENLTMLRHRHLDAYATVVVSGSFEESSYAGRIRASAGDVLVHPELDAHENRRVSSTAELVRLPWLDLSGIGGLYHLMNMDELVRIAEKDVREASKWLVDAIRRGPSTPPGKRNDWPDMLAADLVCDAALLLGDWAQAHALSPETLSRGFFNAYGVVPEVFRAEIKTKVAWFRITHARDRLCAIATEAGFADQAHMTRWIHRITGSSPRAWRQLVTTATGEDGGGDVRENAMDARPDAKAARATYPGDHGTGSTGRAAGG